MQGQRPHCSAVARASLFQEGLSSPFPWWGDPYAAFKGNLGSVGLKAEGRREGVVRACGKAGGCPSRERGCQPRPHSGLPGAGAGEVSEIRSGVRKLGSHLGAGVKLRWSLRPRAQPAYRAVWGLWLALHLSVRPSCLPLEPRRAEGWGQAGRPSVLTALPASPRIPSIHREAGGRLRHPGGLCSGWWTSPESLGHWGGGRRGRLAWG